MAKSETIILYNC